MQLNHFAMRGVITRVLRRMRQSALPAVAAVMLLANAAEARDVPEDRADTVEKLIPAVVNVSTTQKITGRPGMAPELTIPDLPPGSPLEEFRDFFEQFRQYEEDYSADRKAFSLGSGFIIAPDGYIVTNNHVIADAEEITIKLNDEREFKATIVGRDPKTDLALLKVEAAGPLPYVKFGDSDPVRVGDWIIAIGNPFGLGGTVTVGIISARARDINAGPFDDFLQTDAAINTGNSGGPMFNLDGEVIGINTAIFSPSGGNIGIGFATPSSLARPVIKQIKENGKVRRAWLGVKIQTVTADIADSLGLKKAEGALVVEVTPGSPADVSKIYPGDVILGFDGHAIGEMRKFPRLVADTAIGKRAPVTVWRQGKTLEMTVELTEATEQEQAEMTGEPGEELLPEPEAAVFMGMELAPLSDALRTTHEIAPDVNGLWVQDVRPDAVAWEKGLRPFDIITKVNEQDVLQLDDLKASLSDAKAAGRSHALLRIWREGETHFVTLPTSEK